MTMHEIGKIAHVPKNLHGRCVVGAFDKVLHQGSIWTGPISVLYFILHKSIFLHFVHHGTKFYDKYINLLTEKYILINMGVVFFQNRRLESFTMKNIT